MPRKYPQKTKLKTVTPAQVKKALQKAIAPAVEIITDKGIMDPNLPSPEILDRLATALSDPLDQRKDEELAQELGITTTQISDLRRDPRFMEPVNRAFQQNFRASSSTVLKSLMAKAQGGDARAIQLTLQSMGLVDSGGTKILIGGGVAGSGGDNPFSQLSDDELEREIHRLLSETSPPDVTYRDGRVVPIEAGYTVLENADGDDSGSLGRSYLSGEETEVGGAASGEAAPHGPE